MPDISQINVGGTLYNVKDADARNDKQDKITLSGILKGTTNGVIIAEAGTDYAPAYNPYQIITTSTTISSSHYGKSFLINSPSSVTITLTNGTDSAELEIANINTGIVTVRATMRCGADTVNTITIDSGDAVAMKWIGNAWFVIGNYAVEEEVL